jgi:VanZ family protein
VRRPLRWPRVWLSLWLLAVLAVIAVSLLPPPPLPSAPGSDKLGHFLAYFGLMACAVQVFAGRVLIVIALLLVALGLALEFAQGALTSTRMFEVRDALANTVGVLAGLIVARTPAAGWLLRLERRLGL